MGALFSYSLLWGNPLSSFPPAAACTFANRRSPIPQLIGYTSMPNCAVPELNPAFWLIHPAVRDGFDPVTQTQRPHAIVHQYKPSTEQINYLPGD